MRKWIIAIFLLIIIGLIFTMIGCQTKEEPVQPAPEIKEPEKIPEPAVTEEIIVEPEQETSPVVIISEPVREEAPADLLSELRCVDSKIEGVVTNVGSRIMDLSEAIIYINGMLRRNPECDAMMLNPGDSTFCTNLKGTASLKDAGNKLIFRVSGMQAVEIIDCE